jgi:hypothetical protein
MKLNYFGKLKKENGKLVHVKDADRKTYEAFINMIPEGTVVEFFAEVQNDNGSLAQLAKIHAMTRALANHTGHTFEEMKLLIKNEAGMCYTGFNPDGSETVICKSFGDCSSEELSLVIKTAELLGQRVNFLVG